MKRRILVLVLLVMMPWAEIPAQQQSAQTSFKVTATVNAVCEMVLRDLNFGEYRSNTGSPLEATTILDATCTPGSTYNIGLNDGAGGGTIYTTRKMAGAGQNKLDYNLYRDSAHTSVWGNTVNTDTVQDVGNGATKFHTVYGLIPAKQIVPAGNYTDTIIVSVTF